MSKKTWLKKTLDWLLAEEKNDSRIKLDAKSLSMLVVGTLIIIVFVFFPYLERDIRSIPVKIKNCIFGCFNWAKPSKPVIEENYFAKRSDIRNGNFSRGLKYWATSDGGAIFPDSKSLVEVDKNDFYSAPCSLKIETIVPANRIHYCKSPKVKKLDNPYHHDNLRTWMGVKPGAKVNVSLMYKGDILTVYLRALERVEWHTIGKAVGLATDKWQRLELSAQVKADERAIGLEMTLNQQEGSPKPVVLIDDVKVLVSND